MKLSTGNLYFITDFCFERFPDSKLMNNKTKDDENKNGRPFYYVEKLKIENEQNN
ncbi:hypothetical protein MmiAt1_11490 [Methanimicrococcus sp. At1]|uniref:Uncharacterized protein n=1 Tax=Methanimicrococcus hacksteinii TaxID=3028293 RepID=A0ABU3VQI4_9EURY|nr:hypothetical protein [Methanimicrococcus sp. At1]